MSRIAWVFLPGSSYLAPVTGPLRWEKAGIDENPGFAAFTCRVKLLSRPPHGSAVLSIQHLESQTPLMARQVVSRKAKAAEAEAAEKLILEEKAKKKSNARKSKKAAADVRLRLYWGVFSQNLKRVAVFEFDQEEEARKRATELSKGGKSPHFVQRVKEEIKPE